MAANHSSATAMEMLLRGGCPTSNSDEFGWTPLHLATHRLAQGTDGCRCRRCVKLDSRRRQCMRMLLENGAKTDVPDRRHATPAHLAASMDDSEGIRLLRAYRADLWALDDEGRTPLRVARHLHKPSRVVRTLLMLPDGASSAPAPEPDSPLEPA